MGQNGQALICLSPVMGGGHPWKDVTLGLSAAPAGPEVPPATAGAAGPSWKRGDWGLRCYTPSTLFLFMGDSETCHNVSISGILPIVGSCWSSGKLIVILRIIWMNQPYCSRLSGEFIPKGWRPAALCGREGWVAVCRSRPSIRAT